MSAYYDLIEKPDIRQTGEQQPLYARFIPKGTIDRKEFLDRVHLFTGISRSLLEGAMAAFMDEMCDCLADGWTVELGELGYFTPSLSCKREVMEKKELRAASVALRGLNYRLSKDFFKKLEKKICLERHPQSASKSESSTSLLSLEQRFLLLDEYLQQNPVINRAQYARLTGRSYKQAVNDLNLFIEDGLLMRYGAGRNVVYVRKK
ncbi:DNA-binding protein [Bacteroides sp.]|uniref:HU family DNA-binding protein n=1 Tax=Bacteroides sp. TaxID=29523 RepID=UPI0026025939|nr:DNA-binding protein [Bacteroides sp.]